VAADGSPATLLADSFNVQAGWRYLPVPSPASAAKRTLASTRVQEC
jgi:hypothetical protein